MAGEIFIARQDTLENEVLPAVWIAAYKMYGENSYVYRDAEKWKKLCMSEEAANDLDINGDALEFVATHPGSCHTGKWIMQIMDIAAAEKEVFVDLDTMAAVLASETAMAAVLASETAMAAVLASETAMAAVAASETAIGEIIANNTLLSEVVSSTTAMNAVGASATAMLKVAQSAAALHAICKNSAASDAIADGVQPYRSVVKATLDAATTLFTKAGSTEEYFGSYGDRQNWRLNTNTILIPYQSAPNTSSHGGKNVRVYWNSSDKVICSGTLPSSGNYPLTAGVSFRGIGYAYGDTKGSDNTLLYSYVYAAK